MTTVALDLDALNELFDNQKKLDDVLNSMFDEEPIFGNYNPPSEHKRKSTPNHKTRQHINDTYASEDLSFNANDKPFVLKNRSMLYIIVPLVAEVAAIYYGFVYFG